jgi:hypothetical protein
MTKVALRRNPEPDAKPAPRKPKPEKQAETTPPDTRSALQKLADKFSG